jgi:hypothetical protein
MATSISAQTPTATAQMHQPAHAPTGWRTYSSPEYGFSIDYPANIASLGSHPDPADMKGSYIAICETTTVACFEYSGHDYDGTNLESAGLSVNVLRELRTEKDCYDFGDGSGTVTIENIGGINFHYANTGGAGMNQSQGGPAYRAFYQDVCFEVAAGIAEVNSGVFDPGAIKIFDSTKMDALLLRMIRTFRFTGDVADGPGWKVYNDGECGASFEYPDKDEVVEKTIEPQSRFASADFSCSEHFTDGGRHYAVATKPKLKDATALNAWLSSVDFPDLSNAQVVTKSTSWTTYHAEPYYYLFGHGRVYILSVSDSQHRVVSATGDRVFSHLLNTFKMP